MLQDGTKINDAAITAAASGWDHDLIVRSSICHASGYNTHGQISSPFGGPDHWCAVTSHQH